MKFTKIKYQYKRIYFLIFFWLCETGYVFASDFPSDEHHQWNTKDVAAFRQSAKSFNAQSEFSQATPQANTSEIASDLFVTGTKMDVAGKTGRGLNLGRPDETRKRPIVSTNEDMTAAGGAVAMETQENQGQQSARVEEGTPQYVPRDDMDTFESTEKEFQEELKLAYRQLSDLSQAAEKSETLDKP